MAWQKQLRWLLAVCCFYCAGGIAAEQQSVTKPELALLEFLGSMEEEADEWEAFIDIASEGIPPMVVEVENED
jgi:hypothetical protein